MGHVAPAERSRRVGTPVPEFYQGALLALEELKTSGISVKVDLFNTGKSAAETAEILQQPELQNANLIIGPVYDECFSAGRGIRRTARHSGRIAAGRRGKRRQSAAVPGRAGALGQERQASRNEFAGDKNVIVISATGNDSEFAAEIQPLIRRSAPLQLCQRHGRNGPRRVAQRRKRKRDRRAGFDETNIDGILAYVSSVQNSLTSRSIKNPAIRVIGSSRWARLQNIERNLFFKA